MKFLVGSRPSFPVPPEIAPALFDAMAAWVEKYSRSGNIEASWAYAGSGGGGGILNVASNDELDAIMAEFPFGPFSEVKVIALADLLQSLERGKAVVLAMAGG